MYYYSTVNKIKLFHGDLEVHQNIQGVHIRFEKPTKSGFKFAEGYLPFSQFDKSYGFSETKLIELRDYLINNSPLIWQFAQCGGGQNA